MGRGGETFSIIEGSCRLRPARAAEYLGIAKSTLARKRRSGEGPAFIRLGRVIVYDTRDLDAWLAAHRSDGGRDA
jgi:predicted DNA-binding transcriptional regulator AlpA